MTTCVSVRPASEVHLGEAEIEDLEAVAGDHDVAGLEVAMDDAVGVRFGECVGDLRSVARDLRRGPWDPS